MNVSDKLPEVDILIADDRVITILKQMTVAVMAKVIRDRISRQQSSHKTGKAIGAGP